MIPPWLFVVYTFALMFNLLCQSFPFIIVSFLAMFLIVRLAKNGDYPKLWRLHFTSTLFILFQVKGTSTFFSLPASPPLSTSSLEHSLCTFRLPSLHQPPSKNSFRSSRRPFPFNYDTSYDQNPKAIKFSNFVSPTPPPYLPTTSQKSKIYYDT